ncbi:MAG: hypothetical protein ABI759_25750 [Candidatus Solibacter sp.]
MSATISKILEALEDFYGPQEATWPTDPYHYLVWLHCGYPASDERCARGWQSLRRVIGVEPDRILAASLPQLTAALRPGGMVADLRAVRLQEVATVVGSEGGDLKRALSVPEAAARKLLKRFPGVADPGADRILLFAGIAPLAAAPSNCPHVIVRIRRGREAGNYAGTYREARQELERLPANVAARTRAYLLLKRHGQEFCKAAKPKCEACPVREECAFATGSPAEKN